MLVYILVSVSLLSFFGMLYFIKSRYKTEVSELESRDDDTSIYPLDSNIDHIKNILRSNPDTILQSTIHVKNGTDFPFDYMEKFEKKKVTLYKCMGSGKYFLDIISKLSEDRDDLIYFEDMEKVNLYPNLESISNNVEIITCNNV